MLIDEDDETIKCSLNHDNFSEIEYIQVSISRGLILDKIKSSAQMSYISVLDDWTMKKIDATNNLFLTKV